MKILFLPKYDKLGASSRYRTLQYIPYIKSRGIEFDIFPLFSNEYLKYKYRFKKANKLITLRSILTRIKVILFSSYKYDLLVIEKELIPYFPPIFEYYLKLIKKPYIIDYDDAVWHNYDAHKNRIVRFILKKKIATVMKLSEVVIGGSEYIIDYAKKAGAQNIIKIPTVVNLKRYVCENKKENDFIIGWIGSPSTSKYILTINDGLTKFTDKHKDCVVHLIGFDEKLKKDLTFRHKIVEWSEDKEVENLCKIDVGIMPLVDDLFERGKCGFKLVQYMACKKPVIASAVGENEIIVENGVNGFLVVDGTEWIKYLKILYNDRNFRRQLGLNGYKKVEQFYSLENNVKKYLETIKSGAKT